MTDIYDQHKAAFANVSGYVVVALDSRKVEPDRRATLAFKYGRGGRVTCFLHVFGGPMVRGHADGGGYDKATAAASSAARKLKPADYYEESRPDVQAIQKALLIDGGHDWSHVLRDAGYHVFQAV